MTKHPTSRRVHREHHDEDKFVSAALESSAWAKTHGRTLTIAGVVAALAVGGFLYLRNFQQDKNDRAIIELTTVRQTVLQGNRQLAERDLQAYLQKYSGTSAADEARLMLAQIQLEEKKPGEAIKTVEKMAGSPDEPGGASAALLLGAAHELNKQPEKAEQTYLRIADKARFGFEKREALERAASIRMTKGNPAGAAELYERAMNTYPEDAPDRRIYEMRMAEVQAAGPKAGS
jgi:predicted negative regulator of RcsB-dependent stress response